MKGSEHSTKGEASGMKGSESDKGQPGASGKSAQDTAPGQKSKSTEHETQGKDMKAEEGRKGGTVGEGREKSGAMEKQKGMETQKGATEPKGMETQKGATEQKGAETQKGATDTSRSQTTTGTAAAGPPAEKRTQITSAIKSEKIEAATDVDFNVSVGTTIPTSVRLHPLPPKVVEIYPEWRGYEVVLVKGRYVIVKPETHEIVYIIEG
ncbi:DUF1236 domain-containing protein [Bradyrhizobium sp. ORS 111]|uniref:DUF1236 domain-containing protein n=1 Tax=Bradyrhizobium sp. ORS 111 TaxID=1685958 RepID=UPI00388D1755